jgi:hypothetical protein
MKATDPSTPRSYKDLVGNGVAFGKEGFWHRSIRIKSINNIEMSNNSYNIDWENSFNVSKHYKVTVRWPKTPAYPEGKVMFENVVLTNIHKNANGVWEGTVVGTGEVKKWNARLITWSIEVDNKSKNNKGRRSRKQSKSRKQSRSLRKTRKH